MYEFSSSVNIQITYLNKASKLTNDEELPVFETLKKKINY